MAKDRAQAASPVDTSSFVEHLRFVHFALIAACLVICIAITSQTSSSAARAYEQVNELLHLSDLWNNGNWFRNFIRRQQEPIIQAAGVSPQRTRIIELVDAPPLLNMESLFPENHVVVDFGDPTYYGWRLTSAPLKMRPMQMLSIDAFTLTITEWFQLNQIRSGSFTFDTLAGAIRNWDRLSNARNLIVLSDVGDGWMVIHGTDRNTRTTDNYLTNLRGSRNSSASPSDKLLILQSFPGLLTRDDLLELLKLGPYRPGEARPVVDQPDPRVEAYHTLLQLVSADKDTHCFFFDEIHLAALRATCTNVPVSPQFAFTSTLKYPTPTGNFSRSFPDLDELAKHLTTLTLTDLQTFFLAEKNRSGEKIELPMVKLPGESVTTWGIAVLLAIEGYFFIIFREFVRRVAPEDKAWNVPWIGILPEPLSRSAFVFSMLIVPLTVGYVTSRGIHLTFNSWGQVIYVMPVVLATAISAAILYLSWQIILITPRAG